MANKTDINSSSADAVDVASLNSWIPDMPPGPLDRYRARSRFNWKLLKVTLENQELLKLKFKIWNTLATEKEFSHPPTTLSVEEQKRRVMRMLMRFHGLKSKFIGPEIMNSGYVRKAKHLMAMNEALGIFDRSLSVKFALGVSLFGNTLSRLGTDRHAIYEEKAWSGELLGCFAITEFGHGSNTKSFRTTATFDPKSREFVIHTPDFEATKCWSGNLGKTSSYAIVFAQLIVGGENLGLHSLIVPIRDPKTLLPYPGVTIGDMGEKNGLNGIDNGFVMFNQYRIPKENLLNKTGDINSDGCYETSLTSPEQILGAVLEALTISRIAISQETCTTLACAVTIAIRYAAVRRQFGPQNEEIPILEYPLHQWRLFPYLSSAVAFRIFIEDFKDLYLTFFESSLSSNSNHLNVGELAGEIHAIVSASKPLLTWVCRDGLQECREACGGHGYLKAANLGNLRVDHDASVTYEGDNNVLIQQTSNWLLRQATTDKNQPKNSAFGTVEFLERFEKILGTKFSGSKKSDVLCHGFIASAFEWLLCWLIKETDNHLSLLQSQGIDRFTAKTQSQVYRARTLSLVYAENNVLIYFWRRINKPGIDPNVKVVLEKLHLLYGLSCLDKHLTYLYQGGFAQGSRLVNLVRDGIVSLCSDIVPDSVSIVDAIAPPDFVLNSVLGRADGKLYENLKDKIFNQPGAMDRAYWWKDAVCSAISKL